MRIINLRNNAILADKAEIADTFLKRLIGLLNRKSLGEGEALILKPSKSIHTFFMRFPIDVIFLDTKNKVIATLPLFKPFCISPFYFNSHCAIELPVGIIKYTQTQLGDIIKIEG